LFFVRYFHEDQIEVNLMEGTCSMHMAGRGKAVPLRAWCGPESSKKLRFSDYMTTAQDGGKVVSPTHRPHLPPGSAHFC